MKNKSNVKKELYLKQLFKPEVFTMSVMHYTYKEPQSRM